MRGAGTIWRLAGMLLSTLPLAASAVAIEPAPWETWQDLRRLAVVGGPQGSYLAGSHCLDGCRYDRTSIDPGRGGQRFVRIESTRDGEQGVIFEQPGAGAVTRIWMTTGDGVSADLPDDVRLRVYFDGHAEPDIDVALADHFRPGAAARGSRADPPVPLQHDRSTSSGGNVSYLPLPYRDGIKIALLNGADIRLWYQINYTQVPDGTPVAAYEGPEQFADLAWRLAQPWVDGFLISRTWPVTRGRGTDPAPVFHGERADTLSAAAPSRVIWSDDRPGWIRDLRIRVDRARRDDLRIAFTFDGERTVELPLAEFFTADALDARPPRGLLAGVDVSGALYSAIPMPYRRSASIELSLRESADGPPLMVRSAVLGDPTPPPAEAAPLRTRRHVACPTTPSSTGDEILLAHEGSGRMIGLAAWMSGDGVIPGGYYLEGDERLYIDGSVQPLWYGTGVEDLFNGGFYFDRGEFIHPLAGAPLVHAGALDHAASMYRWFLTDGPSWRHSIVFKLENGAYGTEPMCLRTVAFYYGRSTPSQVPLAALQLGDPASESAAQYRRGADARCAPLTATFGDEPPTGYTAVACRSSAPSRFVLSVPTPGTAFRLRRTFDAGLGGQAAEIRVNGTRVGAWADQQANPARRWSQLDVDFRLPVAASELEFEIRPRNGGTVSESHYELWGEPEPRP